MVHHQAVAKGLDVIVKQYGNSVGTSVKDLAKLSVSWLVKMDDVGLRISQHACRAAADLVVPDDNYPPGDTAEHSTSLGHDNFTSHSGRPGCPLTVHSCMRQQYGGDWGFRQNHPMPEGDTVWFAARRLDRALAGQQITASDFRVPRLATADLTGRRVEGVRSYGKHILFRFDGHVTLHTHFRMHGAWHLYRPERAWRGGPDWQIRVVLRTGAWSAVGYRLPVVELLCSDEESRIVGRLGPDVLADDVDIAEVVARIATEPERAIGDSMLDQSVIAGFGLIYVTEGLYLHGVTPWTPVRDVPDLERLITRTTRLMDANKARGAQASTGDLREQHYVYARAGRECRRCGSRIRFGRQHSGAHQRDAYWCPTCQAGPGPT